MQNQAPPSPPQMASQPATEQPKIQPVYTKGLNIGFDFIAFLLVSATVLAGAFSSSAYSSSPDRRIFLVMILLGLLIGLLRSKWRSNKPTSQLWILWLGYAASTAFLLLGILNSSPAIASIALSLVVVVWCLGRMRGEPPSRSVFFAAAILFPFVLELYAKRGYFDWLDSLTLSVTSLLADAMKLPHARTDGLILFKLGAADHFASVGVWDSAVALMGVSVFCTFAFKRGLVAATLGMFLTVSTWVACRSISWIVLTTLSTRTGTWVEWSSSIESMVFAIGAIWVVCLDQFLGECLRPIPFERVDPDYPLLAYIWNWICSLPQVILRIPKENKISLRWRTRVKLAGKKSSLKTDYDWFRFELRDLIFKPIGFLGTSMDTSRSWRISRNWKLLFVSLPLMVLLLAVYGYIGVSLFNRKDIQTPIYAAESLNLCSTKSLEIACHTRQESGFVLATGLPSLKFPGDYEKEASVNTLRYVELLCKRILDIEPNNQLAKYRLGLILSIRNEFVEAEAVMREIVDGKRGEFPQASAWLSKALSIQKSEGKEIAKQDLSDQLDAACKAKEVDFRLLILYGQLLLEQGEKSRAIEVTKQAVALKPDFILELARLYSKIGDEAGKIAAANQAEDYFAAKINFANEKESDRLAVAEARVLANRLDKACEVLSEGLRLKLGGVATSRQLSEVQGMIYRKSIRKLDDGKYDLDLGLLEAMADTDPENPTVSSEITNLLTYNVKPTKKLLDVFKNQMASGVTSFSSLLQLGESYYKIRNLNEAERFWALAVAKEPNNPVALTKLATCLVELSPENAERAMEMVVHANELSPGNVDVLDTWGVLLIAANRPKEAVNKLELALRTNQERIETRRKLKSVYDSLGMKEMAELQAIQIQRLEESAAKPLDNQGLNSSE
jgi:tetratricopeptide (TPR) repeat protein